MKQKPDEWEKFSSATGALLKVSHAEIKSKLEKEKQQKKRKKSKLSSASREAGDGD